MIVITRVLHYGRNTKNGKGAGEIFERSIIYKGILNQSRLQNGGWVRGKKKKKEVQDNQLQFQVLVTRKSSIEKWEWF